MTAEGWVLIIGALGTQVALGLQAWKGSRAIGSPNGLGTIHEALATIDGKLDVVSDRLEAVESRAEALESRVP